MPLFDSDIIKYKKISTSRLLPNSLVYDEQIGAQESDRKHIHIIIINQCNLSCKFCRGGMDKNILNEQTNVKVMGTETFKKIIDKCTDFGVNSFDLTPVIGELMLDKNIFDKLDYLENNSLVSNFVVFTNFLNVDREDIIKLSGYTKSTFIISVYGLNKETYADNTGKNRFNVFLNNVETLYDVSKENKFKNLYFAIRNNGNVGESLLYAGFIRMGYEYGYKLMLHEKDNRNRAGHVDVNGKIGSRGGVCPYGPALGGGIDQYGNFLYCPFNDISKKGIVGNIFNSTLAEIYDSQAWKKIINAHIAGDYSVGICANCNESW